MNATSHHHAYRPDMARRTHLGSLLGLLLLAISGSPHAQDLLERLEGFNYVITWDGGQVARVTISGENGSGRDAPLFRLDYDAQKPASLQNLPAGSAVRMSGVSASGFRQIALGDQAVMHLPHGEAVFVHDNRYEHGNGDYTWIGHQGQDADFRAFFTFGQNGVVAGIINVPDHTYRIETVAGEVWLIDLAKAGLRPVNLADDFRTATTPASAQMPVETAGAPGQTTVDLLALYTPGLENPVTRINFLVAVANQAYIDSEIPLTVRLVGTKAVRYGDSTRNNTALNTLTDSSGRLHKTTRWRRKYGADLVTLVRPYIGSKQNGCGIAWINGARGTPLRPKLAFSIVSEGVDRQGSPYYCDDLTLVHELGHNFGSVHDPEHASVPGKFPYSYGYRLPLSGAGTIMSYYTPRLGYFSNPRILCNGETCGDASYADNARSISQTAPTVAKFRPTVTP